MSSQNVVDVNALIDQEALGARQYLIFALLFLTLAVDGMDTQITSYLAPSIAKEWGISMANLGLVFSAGLAGSATGAIVLGALGDTLGCKRIVLMATSVVGMATIAISFATSTTELVVLRFITGLGVGGSLPNLISLGSQLAPKRLRATVITWTGCGFPAGAALAGVIAGSLLEAQGWRHVYQVAGAFPLLLLPLIVWLLPESIPHALKKERGQNTVADLLRRMYPRQAIEGRLAWMRDAAVRTKAPIAAIFQGRYATLSVLLAVLFLFSLMNVYFLANWLPALLQQAHSTTHESIVATTLFNVGGIFGALVLGRLIDRFGFRKVLTTSLLCVAAFMLTLAGTHHTPRMLLIAAFLGGFVVNGGQGALNSVPSLIFPHHLRATATGWSAGVGRIGFVGPLIAGLLLSAHWTYAEVLMVATIAPVLAALTLHLLAFKALAVADRA